MFENIEKALTIMLSTIGVKLDGDEKGKKICLDETMVKKPKVKHSFSSVTFQRFSKTFQ